MLWPRPVCTGRGRRLFTHGAGTAYALCSPVQSPIPGVGRQPSLRFALLQEVRLTRFVIPYLFSGRGLGLPPLRFWLSTFRSRSTLFTLLRPLSLPGLPGGFQVAATGNEKVSTCEVRPILIAVRNIHVVALWRPWFLHRDETEKSATHDRSAYGLVSGFAVRFVFALRPSFGLRSSFLLRWVACALGALCVPLCLVLTGCPFDGTPTLCIGNTNGDRFTAV